MKGKVWVVELLKSVAARNVEKLKVGNAMCLSFPLFLLPAVLLATVPRSVDPYCVLHGYLTGEVMRGRYPHFPTQGDPRAGQCGSSSVIFQVSQHGPRSSFLGPTMVP